MRDASAMFMVCVCKTRLAKGLARRRKPDAMPCLPASSSESAGSTVRQPWFARLPKHTNVLPSRYRMFFTTNFVMVMHGILTVSQNPRRCGGRYAAAGRQVTNRKRTDTANQRAEIPRYVCSFTMGRHAISTVANRRLNFGNMKARQYAP